MRRLLAFALGATLAVACVDHVPGNPHPDGAGGAGGNGDAGSVDGTDGGGAGGGAGGTGGTDGTGSDSPVDVADDVRPDKPTFDLAARDGIACGGFAGRPCPAKQFCELPEGMCSGADLEGICQEQPDVCPAIYAPVCGCDKKTYANDCERQGAAVQKDHDGAC